MRSTYIVLAMAVLVALTLGCGGGAGVSPTDPDIIPGQLPEQTTPDPATPGTPADPNPVETDPVELDMPQYNNWQDFGLLPMDESLIVEDDLKMPVAYVIGVDEGDVIFGQVELSILATDNIGVNQVALFLNNQLIETLGITSLTYSWDTTQWDDGDYRIGTLLRDDGNNYSMVVVNVVVDNTSDLQAPEIVVTSLTSTVEGVTVVDELVQTNYAIDGWWVCGFVHVSIQAIDASEITSIRLLVRNDLGDGVWSDGPTMAETTGSLLEFDWNTYEAPRHLDLLVRAEDIHGHASEYRISAYTRNLHRVSGVVNDSDDEPIAAAEIFVMPADWNLADGNVETLMIEATTSEDDGKFQLNAVPVGSSKFLFRSGELVKVIPIYFPPLDRYTSTSLTREETRLE